MCVCASDDWLVNLILRNLSVHVLEWSCQCTSRWDVSIFWNQFSHGKACGCWRKAFFCVQMYLKVKNRQKELWQYESRALLTVLTINGVESKY